MILRQVVHIAGWLLGSYFLGGYGPDSQGVNGLNRAAVAAVRSWAVGVPVSPYYPSCLAVKANVHMLTYLCNVSIRRSSGSFLVEVLVTLFL